MESLQLRLPIRPRRVLATRQEVAFAAVRSDPDPGTKHRLVTVEDVWMTAEEGPWIVAYKLALQDGRLVIGELRIYPAASRVESRNVDNGAQETIAGRPPQPWSDRRLLGLAAPVPPGGLTSSFVRRIKPATYFIYMLSVFLVKCV
jgi:hypothetical protein